MHAMIRAGRFYGGATADVSPGCGFSLVWAAVAMACEVFDEMPKRRTARRLQFWLPSYGVVARQCVIAWALTPKGTTHSCSANGVAMTRAKLEREQLEKEIVNLL